MPKQMTNRRESRHTVASLRNPDQIRRSKLVYWTLFAAFACLMAYNGMSLT